MPESRTDLKKVIENSGLKNGMRISFHHHLRLGDRVVSAVLPVLSSMGFRNLTLSVSSVMGEACAAVLEAGKQGTLVHLETTGMKEPLSGAVARGEWPGTVIFRTHGGRAAAVETGRTPVDVAFIAASAVDSDGNLNGVDGPNRFGSLGYGMVDARFAAHVVAVTDFIAKDPLRHVSVPGDLVDQILGLDSIGDRSLISGGSLRKSRRPIDRLIARRTADVLSACGVLKDGLAYQAGSGAVSLLVSDAVVSIMGEKGIRGSLASGGITAPLAEALKKKLFSHLYDVQSFDGSAVDSLAANERHIEMDAGLYANPFRPDRISARLDTMILSGTEIDVDFNLNSLTGTNGRILGALGGAPDTAEDAGIAIVAMPAMRGRIPTVNHRVRTVCTPGSSIDVLVTERGISVNPRREDLLKNLRDSGIETVAVHRLCERIHRITGTPREISGNQEVARVESRRGKNLDTIRCIVD